MQKGWIFVYRRHRGDVDEYMDLSKLAPTEKVKINLLQVVKILFQILMML